WARLQSYRPASMAGLAIRPFTEQDIDAAATLLAARHDRHREVEPLLPADVDFRAQIESEWHVEGASGVIALRGDDAVGYLVGRPLPFGSPEALITGLGGH